MKMILVEELKIQNEIFIRLCDEVLNEITKLQNIGRKLKMILKMSKGNAKAIKRYFDIINYSWVNLSRK